MNIQLVSTPGTFGHDATNRAYIEQPNKQQQEPRKLQTQANPSIGLVSRSSARRTVVDDARRRLRSAAHNAFIRNLAGAAVHLSTGQVGETFSSEMPTLRFKQYAFAWHTVVYHLMHPATTVCVAVTVPLDTLPIVL